MFNPLYGYSLHLSCMIVQQVDYLLKGLIYSDVASGEAWRLVFVIKSACLSSFPPFKHLIHGTSAALLTA